MSEIDIYKGMVRNMKDDIKEIMRDLEFCSDTFDYTITPGRCTFLKNYITNLQQENERLNHQLELQKELTERNRLRKHCYKSRCEKAVEIYDETITYLTTINGEYMDSNTKRTIQDVVNKLEKELDILNGKE